MAAADKISPFRAEELAAMRTAFWGRTAALLIIIPLVTIVTPWPGPIYIYGLIAIFALLGFGAWKAGQAKRGQPWLLYVFVTADFMLLTFTLVYPNPLVPVEFPPQFVLRFSTFIYFFVLLAGLVYIYRPALLLWGGVSATICWSAALIYLVNKPDTVLIEDGNFTVEMVPVFFGNPYFIDTGPRLQEVVVFALATGLLTLAVMRARAIALRQARAAEERANLARYFPARTADMLAQRTDPFAEPAEHKAAVLFADLVAFTSWAEKHSPAEAIDLLREVQGQLADVVFQHHGTLDKFIGDGLMATFGTPEPSPRDASDALAAMLAMMDRFEAWQKEQRAKGREPVSLAIGVHYGPVIIGNIGSTERLEFAVLGDTVNVASRLEAATRAHGCRALVSRDLAEAARSEDPARYETLAARLEPVGAIPLRGRDGDVAVLALK